MIPKITCQKCGKGLDPSERFCSSCGAEIEWHQAVPREVPSKTASRNDPPAALAQPVCPLCGNASRAGAESCESCGASLGRSPGQRLPEEKLRDEQPAKPLKTPPLRALQSWKLTISLAVVLIAVVVILKNTRGGNPHAESGVSPTAANLIQEIESVQKAVDANPGDAPSILRLANLLHDVKFYPKAIMAYERYLQINPSDADARVDLGTSYFALSFTDSTRSAEDLQAAKAELEKALTVAPKHQLAHFNLGIVSFHTGDIPGALDHFKRCVEIDPATETGRKAQQFLSQHSSTNPS